LGSNQRQDNYILILNFKFEILNQKSQFLIIKLLKTALIITAAVFLFALRLQFLPKLDLKEGTLIKVTGVLNDEPQVFGGQQKIVMGRFIVTTGKYPEFHYGDELEIVGKVKTQNKNFLISSPKIIKKARLDSTFKSRQVLSIKGGAIRLRLKLLGVYNKLFPKPYDGIVSGIVLGDKSLIEQGFYSSMQATGTLHIMVASGMNIAMISQGILAFFLLFFKRRTAILCLLGVIWFYSILTGMNSSIVRAACMVSLIYLSNLLGRETDGGRVLMMTGLLMVFINPYLIFDISFQLSFMATAGLVWIQPRLKNIQFVLFKNENFSSSIAAQLTTLPILVINFGQVNLLSPLINLAVLWTVPYILQFGLVISLLGLLWIKLGQGFSYLLYPMLFFLKQTIETFAKIIRFQIHFSNYV